VYHAAEALRVDVCADFGGEGGEQGGLELRVLHEYVGAVLALVGSLLGL